MDVGEVVVDNYDHRVFFKKYCPFTFISFYKRPHSFTNTDHVNHGSTVFKASFIRTPFLLEIDADALLVAVDGQKVAAFTGVAVSQKRRPPIAGVVTADRMLDLYDLGTLEPILQNLFCRNR